MNEFSGYLFSKLHAIGTRSEGPIYFLQCFDYKELPILKQSSLFQEDSNLHPFLAKKVTIYGTYLEDGISYERITDFDHNIIVTDNNSFHSDPQ